jgi:ankyrin repeat protein
MVAAAQTAPAEGAMFLPSSTRPIDIAKGLIERGANVNAQSTKSVTALMIAATHNNPPMIGLLMESGADASLKDDQGQTATDVAKRNGNIESAQAIVVLGAAKAAEGETSPAPEKGQGTSSQ